MTQNHYTTSIFANCSKHYEFEILLETCTNSTNPCHAVSQIQSAITIAYVDYYTSVALFSIAALLDIYCLIITIPLYRRMKDDSKKKYVFLITRCISGLLLVVAWLLIQCIYLRFIAPSQDNLPYYVLALALNIGSTYVLLGSYVGMAGILYLGVLNPIAFNQHLTLRIVYIAVCIIFVISIFISIPLAIFQALMTVPTSSMSCTDTACAPLITLINFVLVFGSLITTTLTLTFVLISLCRHRKEFKKLDTTSNTSLNSAVRLLKFTLFAVLLLVAAEVIPFVISETKKKHSVVTGCYYFYHSGKVIQYAVFALTESSIWSIALIIDPLINIIFDRTVSKKATDQVKWMRKSCVGLVRKVTKRSNPENFTETSEI